jgi:asparagine synthase (glutamine-hydrolysing)
MGTLVAVLSKKGQDVTRTAVDMLETLESRGTKVYGLASSSTLKRGQTFKVLQEFNVGSSVAVGYAFSRIVPRDEPQPLKLQNAAIVFDGRIYGLTAAKSDAETAMKELSGNLESAAVTFIRKTEGDFAFAVAQGERIVAGRDVLGVRPLYWGESAEFAALSSERKLLWKIGIGEVHSFPPGCVSLVGSHGFEFIVAERIIHSRPKRTTMQSAAYRLQKLLECSVERRVLGLKEVAIAFSGGLDSSIIASLVKRRCAGVILTHVSLKNGSEVESARQAAEELKLPLHLFIFGENDVQRATQKIVSIIEKPNPVSVSIGIPLCWAAEKIAGMGCRVMLAGQAADEFFGGYRRYLDDYLRGRDDEVENAIFNDIIGLHEADMESDFKICNYFNVELRLPFATPRIARFALNLPLELKMERTTNALRKLILRRVAKNIGLPQSIVDRPKKAIQYATGTSEAIRRIARQEGLLTAEYLRNVFEATFRSIR